MKFLMLACAAVTACGTTSSSICSAPTYSWTVQADGSSVPLNALIGQVPDEPHWPITYGEPTATVSSGAYLSTVGTPESGTEFPAGVIRFAGWAHWFVPSNGELPEGEFRIHFAGESANFVGDNAATAAIPGEVEAPTLSFTEAFHVPHVEIGGTPPLPTGWYELEWSVDDDEWSEPGAWSGAPFRMTGTRPPSGFTELDSCGSSAPFDQQQSFAVRVRSVALDGSPGEWSGAETIDIR